MSHSDTTTGKRKLDIHSLEEWLDMLREYQIMQTSRPPTWENLSKRQRLARIRAAQGAFKDDLPSTWEMLRDKQADIERE